MIPVLPNFYLAKSTGTLPGWHKGEPRAIAKAVLLSGGSCISEGSTSEMTSSTPNQSLTPLSEGFRAVQMLEAKALDLRICFQTSVANNQIQNPLIEKLIKIHLGETSESIRPGDIDLCQQSIAEAFKIFSYQQR